MGQLRYKCSKIVWRHSGWYYLFWTLFDRPVMLTSNNSDGASRGSIAAMSGGQDEVLNIKPPVWVPSWYVSRWGLFLINFTK